MSSSAHVLLLDDETLICESLRRAFTRRGYRVTACLDPLVAIVTFERAPADFDLLFTDMTMPASSGIDVIRVVRVHRPDLPVILYSAYMTPLWESEAIALGVSRILAKPTPLDQLLAFVAEVLAPAS